MKKPTDVVRLSPKNTKAFRELVKESSFEILTLGKAVNDAAARGISGTRRKYVKGKK